MWTNALAFFLLLSWSALAVAGVVLVLRRRWLLGVVLLLEGVVAFGVTVALANIPIGIGENLLRVPADDLWRMAFVALALAGLCGWLVARSRRASAPHSPSAQSRAWLVALAAVAPLASAAGIYALVYVSTPERERERDADKRAISLPSGFSASQFVRAGPRAPIDNPIALAFAPDGWVYLSDIGGAIWRGQENPATHTVDAMTRFADGFTLAVGLLWHNGELFVASSGKIEALRDSDGDGVADARRVIASGLPSMVLVPHSNNALTMGPDGRIYFGTGATDRNEETTAFGSSIASVSTDGGDVQVFARGFGNPFKLAFNARGDMFAGDNSLANPQFDDDPPDELNHIVKGGNYGFPIRGATNPMASPPAPLVAFPTHSVPTGITFYYGNAFPRDYTDNAFVALWNTGEIVRAIFTRRDDGGYVARARKWGEGFLYPVDVSVGPDGNLYVVDFGANVVYRVTYSQP